MVKRAEIRREAKKEEEDDEHNLEIINPANEDFLKGIGLESSDDEEE